MAKAKATGNASPESPPRGGAILLYDGVCGLCNRLVRFLIARDRRGRLRFAPLQSGFAARALARHGRDAARLDTVYLITRPGTSSERVLSKSRAVLGALEELGGSWRPVGILLRVVPPILRDALYGLVAQVRYRVFGRSDRCVLPPAEDRARFLDVGQGA
ncbi:MAG: thiol-disulfide oxidoreductase DCC family protein [Thermoanaerobaculia bacterium]